MIYADEAKTLGLEAIPYYTADQMQTAWQAGRDSMKADAQPQDHLVDANKMVQKPWVGLTDEEVKASHPYAITRDKGCFHAGALWAQEKLKERNT